MLRRELLPDYLQPTVDSPQSNLALQAMQRIKDLAQEHVRFRSVPFDETDQDAVLVTSAMHASVKAWEAQRPDPERNLDIQNEEAAPGSASESHQLFIRSGHERNLEFLKMKGDDPAGAILREQHGTLLSELPTITEDKFREAALDTPMARAQVVTKLTNKYSGELVELDRKEVLWSLEPVAPGSASTCHLEQWLCCPKEAKAGMPDLEYDCPGLFNLEQIGISMDDVLEQGGQFTKYDLFPNCDDQVIRIACPCHNPRCGYRWVRHVGLHFW